MKKLLLLITLLCSVIVQAQYSGFKEQKKPGEVLPINVFGRVSTAEDYTQFDNSFTSPWNDSVFWSQLTHGTATCTYDSLNSQCLLTVAASGDYTVRQTKQRFKYQPGKAKEVLLTGLLTTQANVRKRVGYVDYDNINLDTIKNIPQNGVYFENNAGVLSWNIVKNGTVTETATSGEWNMDKLNGGDGSGKTLDIGSVNIFYIDLEWLGVGSVRVGFVIDGEIVICHQFNHASNGFTSVYMRTANLPVAYECTATGAGGGSLSQICSKVSSAGGFNPAGVLRAVSDTVDVGITNGTTELLVGLRLKPEYFDYTVLVEKITGWNDASNSMHVELVINPTYGGSVTWYDLKDSHVQWAANNDNAVTDKGLILDYFTVAEAGVQATGSSITSINTSLNIGKGLDDGLDEIWLIGTADGGTTVARAAIIFKDLF